MKAVLGMLRPGGRVHHGAANRTSALGPAPGMKPAMGSLHRRRNTCQFPFHTGGPVMWPRGAAEVTGVEQTAGLKRRRKPHPFLNRGAPTVVKGGQGEEVLPSLLIRLALRNFSPKRFLSWIDTAFHPLQRDAQPGRASVPYPTQEKGLLEASTVP